MDKPVVRYRGTARPLMVSGTAWLQPIDHPSAYISNTKMVMTTKVLSWDEVTGRIETQNTIYLPEEK
jgi:hypothetical protein